jgi:hypothetical protein
MEICSNCLKKKPQDYPFCPFCGFSATRTGLKKCSEGHIIYETWKTCSFCAQIENLGKSIIDLRTQVVGGMKTEVLNAADPDAVKKAGVSDRSKVLENCIDDKTRLETMSMPGMTLDKTVMESEAEKTVVDEGIMEAPPLQPFFAWLVLLSEDGKPVHDIRLTREKSVIGKGTDADIRLNDDFASKLHAVIHFEEERFFISDLGSTNHTWLNGKKIIKEELQDGDFIRIGHQETIFKHVRRKL